MKHLTPLEAWQYLQERPEALFVDVRMEIEYLYVGHPPGVVHVAWYEYPEMQADPEAFVGSRIRVTGSVFFHAVCPPPGATAGPCVLLGYLADPAQRAFISADEPGAIALAEDGARVACEEADASMRACPGWSADSTYTLAGVLAHQMLGGKETELVQLEVEEKSAPQPW